MSVWGFGEAAKATQTVTLMGRRGGTYSIVRLVDEREGKRVKDGPGMKQREVGHGDGVWQVVLGGREGGEERGMEGRE